MARGKGKGRHEPSLEDVEWFEELLAQAAEGNFDLERDLGGDGMVDLWGRLTGRRLTEDSWLEMSDLWMDCERAVREYREARGG